MSDLIPPVSVDDIIEVQMTNNIGRAGDVIGKFAGFVVFVKPPITGNKVRITKVGSRSAVAVCV